MSEYVFDQAWERERDRLRGLESLFDGATTRFLAARRDRGLELPGGRVWCRGGGVVVGRPGRHHRTSRRHRSGHRFIDGHGRSNLEVRTHDISTGPPEEAAFDLVHARAVIEHVRDHETALDNLSRPCARAVGYSRGRRLRRPDGGGTCQVHLPIRSRPVERHLPSRGGLFASVGADASFGTHSSARWRRLVSRRSAVSSTPPSSAGVPSNGHVALSNSSAIRSFAPAW